MKKLLIYLVILILFTITILFLILSSVGIETSQFNKFITKKVSQTKNINLKLDTIKFKLDPRELSLFLETQSPKVSLRNISVPVQNIKVYVDFLSLFKSQPKIKKINIVSKELDILEINKLSLIIKPSNFKSLVNNKIKKGKLNTEIEIFLNDEGIFENFIAKGKVKDLKIIITNDLSLTKTSLGFFADKNDVLLKNIFGNFEDIKISDGDIKLNFENGIKLSSNFKSSIDYNEKKLEKVYKYLKKYNFVNQVKYFKADLINNFTINFDKTYKIQDYNYSINGNLEKTKIDLLKPVRSAYLFDKIKNIYISNFKIQTSFKSKKLEIEGAGKYSFDDKNFNNINLKNEIIRDTINLGVDFDFQNSFKLDLINYKKSKDTIAKIDLDITTNKNITKINRLNINNGNDSIKIEDLRFKENLFSSLKKIEINTTNNNFYIKKDKKILVKGNKFDATNLAKYIDNQQRGNNFQKLNSEIEIDLKNVSAPLSEKLTNFKLFGQIKNGKFVKISAKGDFGGNKFLDISMKKDKNTEKKYLEIYSDLTRPLLAEYSFFKGLSGGKLLYTSIINGNESTSKLKIESFKVINAPGLIRLLSLADLSGLADLAEGDGLSFDVLEIDIEKNKKFLKLNEILALGPSMSVLMEGYQDENNITSLRGTLVPAKTLNKMISKIPVIGNIVIPKEVGEGMFGISFKMKGPKGNIKTTINPIRTITPRFIQKIIDKNKEVK